MREKGILLPLKVSSVTEIRPHVVDWQITSECTRSCKFCYGPKSGSELPTKEAFKIIDIFEEIGVKVIGITGGEPLIRRDIVDILKYIKRKHMAVCLSTNCDLYKKYRDIIFKYVDAIGIPIEGSNRTTHDHLRGPGSFDSVLFGLNDVYENSNIKIRIATVLTHQNYSDLKNIELLLERFADGIVYWKIYEYIIYSMKWQNSALSIKHLKYLNKHLSELGKHLSRDKICFDTLEKRHRSYFLIKPCGDVFIPLLEKIPSEEYIIGNIVKEPEKVINNWKKQVDFKSYTKPYRCIFRKDNGLKCTFLRGE